MPLGGSVTTVFTVGLNAPSAPVLPLSKASASPGANASNAAAMHFRFSSEERLMSHSFWQVELNSWRHHVQRVERRGRRAAGSAWHVDLDHAGTDRGVGGDRHADVELRAG